ncbi:MAG: guanine deaminase [Methyloceanibacter sp.]
MVGRQPSAPVALRGTLVSFAGDPFLMGPDEAVRHESDGLVVCRGGLIEAAGPYGELRRTLSAEVPIADYSGCIISAGLIDAHIHYVQSGIIAAPGKRLLDWVSDYVYPVEESFADEAHARAVASFFCDTLLRSGTTTACVYCAVYPQSADALFAEASARNMRIIAGKCMMDRNVPEALRDTAKTGYDQSKALIEKWHGKGRLLYAITPRWAGSSTPAQLEAAGALWRENPSLHVQTHIAETEEELAFIAKLFPERKDFLDVYEHYGLVGRRSVLGHAIWFSEQEFCRCHERDASIAHCPTSNLFLGSGLFRLREAKARARPIQVGIGTDIGAGTSFSQLASLNGAYKIAALNRAPIMAFEGLYLATRGGARALDLDDRIGSLETGREADLVVLDPAATPLLAFRTVRSRSLEETLFILMTLGDERAVRATYVGGALVHERAVDA